MVVDIGSVRHDVSELLHAVCTKPLDICCGFYLNFGFKFWVSQFLGEEVPLWWCALVVSDISELLQAVYTDVSVAVLLLF